MISATVALRTGGDALKVPSTKLFLLFGPQRCQCGGRAVSAHGCALAPNSELPRAENQNCMIKVTVKTLQETSDRGQTPGECLHDLRAHWNLQEKISISQYGNEQRVHTERGHQRKTNSNHT